MPLTSIIHGYVSHQIDGTTFPAFSLWKAAEWVAQLTHRLNLPRSPLPVAHVNITASFFKLDTNLKIDLRGHCIEFKYYAGGIHSGLTPPG